MEAMNMRILCKGFTLIEIAVVLVIIGLLLGGVLKGQELITSARVRNLVAQQEGVKTAFFGFQDRYRALPGDYASANVNVNCGATPCVSGNGNGRIEAPNTGGIYESILAWNHLTAAGFLNGAYTATSADTTPTDINTPKNPYSAYVQLVYDNNYGAGAVPMKHNFKTGGQIPVEIIAEVDRKIDDGNPYRGAFQFTAYVPAGGIAPDPFSCTNGMTWAISGGDSNCGGASLF